eukprot:14555017-Ditylum_brightwellii.AAC.2
MDIPDGYWQQTHQSVQGNLDLLESLRTEGMSHLAGKNFLCRYCKFFKISLQGEDLQHYMDNSAVVQRMQWYQEQIMIFKPRWNRFTMNYISKQKRNGSKAIKMLKEHRRIEMGREA